MDSLRKLLRSLKAKSETHKEKGTHDHPFTGGDGEPCTNCGEVHSDADLTLRDKADVVATEAVTLAETLRMLYAAREAKIDIPDSVLESVRHSLTKHVLKWTSIAVDDLNMGDMMGMAFYDPKTGEMQGKIGGANIPNDPIDPDKPLSETLPKYDPKGTRDELSPEALAEIRRRLNGNGGEGVSIDNDGLTKN